MHPSIKRARITLLSCPETDFCPNRREISDFDNGSPSINLIIRIANDSGRDSGCDSGFSIDLGIATAAGRGKLMANQCSDTSMRGSP